jgi:hypothetical protein
MQHPCESLGGAGQVALLFPGIGQVGVRPKEPGVPLGRVLEGRRGFVERVEPHVTDAQVVPGSGAGRRESEEMLVLWGRLGKATQQQVFLSEPGS